MKQLKDIDFNYITRDSLIRLDVDLDIVDWWINNIGDGFPIAFLNNIEGDYRDYIRVLKECLLDKYFIVVDDKMLSVQDTPTLEDTTFIRRYTYDDNNRVLVVLEQTPKTTTNKSFEYGDGCIISRYSIGTVFIDFTIYNKDGYKSRINIGNSIIDMDRNNKNQTITYTRSEKNPDGSISYTKRYYFDYYPDGNIKLGTLDGTSSDFEYYSYEKTKGKSFDFNFIVYNHNGEIICKIPLDWSTEHYKTRVLLDNTKKTLSLEKSNIYQNKKRNNILLLCMAMIIFILITIGVVGLLYIKNNEKHIDSGTPQIRDNHPNGYLLEQVKLKDGTTWDILCIEGVKNIYDTDKRLVSETNLVCF